MKKIILSLLLLTSCYKQVRAKAEVTNKKLPWCFETSFKIDGELELSRFCYSSGRMCRKALHYVVKYGKIAEVTSTTDCKMLKSCQISSLNFY